MLSNFFKPSLGLIPLCVLLFALTGCGGLSSDQLSSLDDLLSEQNPDEKDESYIIGAGDELSIKFFFAPDLNDHMQVAPDGTISIMFAPHVRAAGLTVEQLTARLKKKLAGRVKQPDMVVSISRYGSQKAFVGGEVFRPGSIPLTGPATVLQIITEAGWVTPTADTEDVRLLRRDPETQETAIYPIDVAAIMDGDVEQNVFVRSGDVILVPPSGAASLDRWVDQNIRQVLPFSTSAGATYYLNPTAARP